jgi:NAD(P)-dependent dehydrogenase (short-subunit alcohol dehydrogenase family)
MRSSGKKVLVTGGTSGIGEASVIALANNGADVVCCGRNIERGQAIEAATNTNGSRVKFVKADVAVEAEVNALFQQAIEFLGDINCAFNNAGIEGEMTSFNDSSKENWDKVLNANLNSIWLCMKKEVNHMLDKGQGTIVNMASTSGLVGNGFGLSAYAASKFAVIGLSKSVALEYAKKIFASILSARVLLKRQWLKICVRKSLKCDVVLWHVTPRGGLVRQRRLLMQLYTFYRMNLVL